MKYSSTTRLINVIIFALLAVGFGVLGVYFEFIVAPYLWVGNGPIDLPDLGWGLVAMLGALGVSGLLISLYGLFTAVRSVLKGNDDALVRRSFSSYVALGYLVAIFFLINGVWLYRLTSTNIGYDDIGFVVVVYIIAFLIAIIVSNIPVLRMYGEGEELNKIMRIITGALTAIACSLVLVYGISWIVLASAGDVYQKAAVSTEFLVGTLCYLAAFVLVGAAFLGYGRADKAGVINKLNGILFELGLMVIGGSIIGAGAMEYVQQSGKNPPAISLVGKTVPTNNAAYMDFSIMAWIFGGVIVLFACYLLISTLNGKENKK